MSGKALICDDAAFMRSIIRRVLTTGGYEVVGEADSGTKALVLFSDLAPDFVTMDVVMPDMSGIDVVRQLLKKDPDARVIMCSGVGQIELVDEALEAGAMEFVVKPFEPSRLLEAVDSVMQED